MQIKFQEKFTSKHLDEFVAKYWAKTIDINNNEDIVFDLSELKWVAVEEIVFLFGWFRKLVLIGKSFKFKLADFGKFLNDNNIKRPISNVSNSLSTSKWLIENIEFLKYPQNVRTSINLWHRWEIAKCFAPNNISDYYIHESSVINKFLKAEEIEDQKLIEDGKQYSIIPFKILKNNSDKSLIGLRNQLRSKLSNIYSIEKEITNLLNEEGCSNPFDNKTLSNIITVELFLNALLHSFEETEPNKESYLGISVNHKQKPEKYKNDLLERKIIKNEKEAYDYIQARINKNYTDEKTIEELEYYKIDDLNYRNESFINFSFLDFGKGIISTLRDQYLIDKNSEYIIEQMSENNSISEDSKILEYAFLLHSSQYPILTNIEKIF
jgi:hypothetical protein